LPTKTQKESTIRPFLVSFVVVLLVVGSVSWKNEVISACGKCQKLQEAMGFLEMMEFLQIQPTAAWIDCEHVVHPKED